MCPKEYFIDHKFKEMLLRLKVVPNFKKKFNILSCLIKLKEEIYVYIYISISWP